MAKRRSLISELSKQDVKPLASGTKIWRIQFEESQPDDYASIKEAVEDWLNGGTMKALFPSRSALKKYLTGKHPTAKCDPPILPHVADNTFYKLLDHIEGGLHGKAKAN